jgi:hypothetical protein
VIKISRPHTPPPACALWCLSLIMPGGPHPPLAVILSWPAPNYVNPESQGNALVVVSLLLASLATVLVVLRISTRVWIIRHPGADDFFVVLGLVQWQSSMLPPSMC